jgi:hypothetical protein
MRIRKLWLGAAVALVLGCFGASAGIASVLTRTVGAGGAETYAVVTREDAASTSSSTSFVTIPGATALVSVTDGSDLIMARFSAESACYNSTANTSGNWCSVRLMLKNRQTGAMTELYPASGLDFAFDSTNAGAEGAASWESHSMDRSIRVGNGSYYVVAERATTSTQVTFRLDDWSLTAEKST